MKILGDLRAIAKQSKKKIAKTQTDSQSEKISTTKMKRPPSYYQGKLLGSFALWLCTLGYWVQPAQAEGSRTLYPSGATGNRASLYTSPTLTLLGGTLKTRSIFKVYANTGEYINVGSTAVGFNSGDVTVYNPGLVTGTVGQETIPATPSFSCSNLRTSTGNNTLGRITSRTQELAGPDTITNALTGAKGNAITNSYAPCYYQAPSTGVYSVIFTPPNPSDTSGTGATGDINMAVLANFDGSQNAHVSAWDITVRTSLTSTTDLNGRLFAYYTYMRHGNNSRFANFSVYPVTLDGYRYKIDLKGLDPNAFAVYGNQSGFFDSDGVTPLYHDVLGSDDFLTTITGGAIPQIPQFPTFFNPPNSSVISYLGIPLITTAPVVSGFSYLGSLGGNNSLVSAGGTFTYTANVGHTYEIIISRDGVDFDPTNINNRVLRGIRTGSTQTINWDGKDNNGTAFPVGSYSSKIFITSGEYHFPLIDAENNPNGGPTFTLLNAPGACISGNCSTAFYDDRGYKLSNGTTVGTVGSVLSGNSPPSTAFSGVSGFNTSTSTQRTFGTNTTTGWGDKKGLDIWTYFPSNAISVPLNILALTQKIGVAKQAGTLVNNNDGTFTVPFTIAVQNYGTEALKNVQVTEDLLTTFTNLGATNINVSTPAVVVNNAGTGTPATNVTSAGAAFTGKGGATNTGGANNLLAGGASSILAVGAKATITFNVTFKPGTNTNTFNNTVVASGTGNGSNTNASDQSTNGTDPDNTPGAGTANGDNDPTNNTSPTPVDFPKIGVAKAITNSVVQVNGSHNITYSIKIKNYGSESLTGVQVTDDLLGTFTPLTAGNITIVTPPVVTVNNAGTPVPNVPANATSLTANASFTGKGGTANTGGINNLLSGTSVLAQGADATITFTVNVQPGATIAPFNNTAKGTATGAATTVTTTDDSQDGTDPDNTPTGLPANNGDGNPGNNNTPTVFTITIPAVSGYKSVKLTKDNDNSGSTVTPGDEVTWTVFYVNTGTVDIINFQETDTLPAGVAIAGTPTVTVSGTGQATPTANSSYNGTNNINLLSSPVTLKVGGTIAVNIPVTINASTAPGTTLQNQAAGNGVGLPLTGIQTERIDNNTPNLPSGVNIPANSIDQPPVSDGSYSTLVYVNSYPHLILVKRITAINGVSINSYVNDPSSTEDNDPKWPLPLNSGISTYLRGATNVVNTTKPGDNVEYTIYFLSNGSTDISNISICDTIPQNTTFVKGKFNGSTPTDGGLSGTDLGIELAVGNSPYYLTNIPDSDRGEFFLPGTQAPVACNKPSFASPLPGISNSTGSVVVNVTRSQTPLTAGSYGFIRFHVKVN